MFHYSCFIYNWYWEWPKILGKKSSEKDVFKGLKENLEIGSCSLNNAYSTMIFNKYPY